MTDWSQPADAIDPQRLEAVSEALRYMRTLHKTLPSDADAVRVWADQLQEIPIRSIMAAAREACRAAKFAPKPSELIEAHEKAEQRQRGWDGSVPQLESRRLPRGESVDTVPVSRWDKALEHGVLYLIGGKRDEATQARNTLTARYGSIDVALATFQGMIDGVHDTFAGVYLEAGVGGWRQLRDRLPEIASRHWDHLNGRASVQTVDTMLAGLAHKPAPPEPAPDQYWR